MTDRISGCIPALFAAACILVGCNKPDNPGTDPVLVETELQKEYRCVNTFAYNMMSTYYLWNKEVAEDLKSWGAYEEPAPKVLAVRYKNSSGEDVDRWTQLTDDYSSFTSSMEGTGKTYGFDYVLYYADASRTNINMVVVYVYDGTPAQKAGLSRGNVITELDGTRISAKNYTDLVTGMSVSNSCTFTLQGGSKLAMNSVAMYVNPVHTVRTLSLGIVRVGYLHFTSFTPDCYQELIDACRQFKEYGVTHLVLDLRYNGGGLVETEHTLASMLAPEADVKAGSVYEKTVYNSILTDAGWGNSYSLTSEFDFSAYGRHYVYSTADANIGIEKLYVLVGAYSASASECLINSLKPYVPVVLLGEKTYGKYCTGIVYSAAEWYDDVKSQLSAQDYAEGKKYSDNYGIYVMIGRYADKNGNTGCMPDGFQPDYKVQDNPLDGYQLGDPAETMFAAALNLISGGKPAAARSQESSASSSAMLPVDSGVRSSLPGRVIGDTGHNFHYLNVF